MKFSYVSDLHLEFGYGDLTLPGGDVLLLAGDIVCVAHALNKNHVNANLQRFINEEVSKYAHCYAVMGNHEHYHGNVDSSQNLLAVIAPRIKILENESVQLQPGLRLFGTTLWTDYNNADEDAMNVAMWSMNDHRLINATEDGKERRFTTNRALCANITARECLKQELANYPDEKYIIMTHHTPAMSCGNAKWGTDTLNYAFHNSNLVPLIQSHQNILHWISGHTHDSYEGILYGTCKVHINPRGYINSRGDIENPNFDTNKQFEVP